MKGSEYHSPMVTILGGRYGDKPIGRRCLHCGGLFTMNGKPSNPKKIGARGGQGPNRAHLARKKGTPLIGDRLSRRIEKAYRKTMKKGDHHE